MDKYTIRILALALLFLLLVCCPTVAQCRITAADSESEKINLPNGLCVHERPNRCTSAGDCFCCLPIRICFETMEKCKGECEKSSSSESEDILLTMAMASSPP
ncbi:hypothetical protein ZWY2020_047410 [Hordeum vulgare]|nr:hypothetical protein ZWY2020_047410 [Hordeum vulgare]